MSELIRYEVIIEVDGRRKYNSSDVPLAITIQDAVQDMLPEALGNAKVAVTII